MAADNKSKGKPKSKPKGKTTGNRKKANDPRLRITSGVFLMMVGLFLFVSIIAYLTDYNLTGNWGNTIGMWLTRDSFGIGSLYLIFLLTIAGSLLTFKGPQITTTTICKYSLLTLIWLPLMLATTLSNHPNCLVCEKIYGNVGMGLYEILNNCISNIGIYIILIFTIFLYVIFTFDIKMPTFNLKKDIDDEGDDEIDNGGDNDTHEEKPLPVTPIKKEEIEEEEDIDDIEETTDDEDEEEEEVEIVVKHIPHTQDEKPTVIDLGPIEDNEEEEEVEVPIKIEIQKPEEEQNPEIKVPGMEVTVPTEEKQAEIIGEHFGLDTDFDPKLELSNYKFPPLDLLKDYGESSTNVERRTRSQQKTYRRHSRKL